MLTDKGNHAVKLNGGNLYFDVGTRRTIGGYVGFVTIGGVEVFATTGDFAEPKEAQDAATKQVHAAIARLLAS